MEREARNAEHRANGVERRRKNKNGCTLPAPGFSPYPRVHHFLVITRPLNLLLGVLSIFLGAFIAGAIQPVQKVLLACISGGLIMAGGNVINDYFDVEIDKINKPFRPIPSGNLGRRTAWHFSIILFALGIFLSIFIRPAAVGIATLTAAGLFTYSARLKRTVLLGNIAVSFFAALAFIYGAIAIDRWQEALMPTGFAFLFHLGREIIKDVEDRRADKSVSVQTLPVRYGDKVAFAVATGAFALLITFTFVPYFLDIYGKEYLWIVLPGVDLVVVGCLLIMWLQPQPHSLRRVSAILKIDMFVGLTAIYVGAINVR